ncbi:hypothetical protein GU926_08360 [Nibribacter ruber]|uniref:Uncharacterized protein n=1 Tax=Nibribacter ruber TaxID=2698458 RepID=A0A6P1NYZ6_9BACT|nr:hypothetical protein [Nibribacter ruber]QHL87449.1 hypothetical protein GU926_08360 [Nibribacter ruber]
MKNFGKIIGGLFLAIIALLFIGYLSDDETKTASSPENKKAQSASLTPSDANDAESIKLKEERIASAKKQIIALKKSFHHDKDEMSGRGWYDHKVWGKGYPEKNALTCTVFDSGHIMLRSFYTGDDWLFHESVSVKVGEERIDSDAIPSYDDSNRRDNSGGTVWESITYDSDEENGIIALIAQNVEKKILVRLNGDQYYKDITLTKIEKQAIADAYRLSNLIKTANGEDI